ncbi:MAG: HAD family hydrolase, partial [Halarsenatibacteraceae bacterium]
IMTNSKTQFTIQELLDSNNNLLFDLDGTLLPMNMDYFLEKYFVALGSHFSSQVNTKKFIESLLQATGSMIKNDGELTNKEVFTKEFFKMLPELNQQKALDTFDEFYRQKFPSLGDNINKDPQTVKVIEILKSNNKNLILATNPVFPMEAVESRLKWIGLSADHFDLITCYSNMHYCKPNPEYYQEILDKMELDPKSSLMIGNDELEDMIAGELGIDKILIKDNLKESEQGYEPDWQGSRAEFYREVRNWSRR